MAVGDDRARDREALTRTSTDVLGREEGIEHAIPDRIGDPDPGIRDRHDHVIPVDARMRTNVPHISAIGDLVPGPMLAHKALHEAKVAAEVIAAGFADGAGEDVIFDARTIPSVAYTDPEVAWMGLTELEAKAQDIPYEVASFPWAASGRALAMDRGEGVTKLLVDPETRRILGAGATGVHAGDLISEAALALELGAVAGDLALTVHPHPTLSETIGLAADLLEGTITDLPQPRKHQV